VRGAAASRFRFVYPRMTREDPHTRAGVRVELVLDNFRLFRLAVASSFTRAAADLERFCIARTFRVWMPLDEFSG
jgi:hypothetical protein